MNVYVCVYRNISRTTTSASIKFDMHIYFWILNSGKTVIFCFLNNFFNGHFLILEKHYFAFFQSSHCYKQFSYNAFERESNYLLFLVWSSGTTVLFGR
ncbi:hypothetical protein TSAR_012250 [Trichomalopsis sarcophagae]|uniref:Uncharacterized protein n=1 Tax=Trichomalopsis sarcophagae TaxID=543379 RepID=A0A232EVG0_9HYME|nr:hypothetical protein TSAR_012250 [Trichomalopsis sarcophagae]